MHFSYELDSGVRADPVVVDKFLSERRWFRSQTPGGEVVVNGVERWENGNLLSVTITFCGETRTLGQGD